MFNKSLNKTTRIYLHKSSPSSEWLFIAFCYERDGLVAVILKQKLYIQMVSNSDSL